MRVLILDDELIIGQLIEEAARRENWTAVSTSTEAEFQACFADQIPDAVFLDLQLGASDGVQQLKYLQSRHYTGSIVLMSGFDMRVLDSARRLGLSFGLRVICTLSKPMEAGWVRSTFDSLLAAAGPANPAPAAVQRSSDYPEISPATIARAMSSGEFLLHFQPIVSAQDHEVVRLEALIRWMHPLRGLVPPLEFIPVAEEDAALIDGLTMWVIRTALSHHDTLRRDGLLIPVAVNVSGLNLHSPEFPDRVRGLLAERSLPPSVLSLEVTETVAMADTTRITEVLSRLRLKGIALAIDDLGTGYSSLAALRKMPFSELKIDGTFIRDIATSADTLTIVKSLIDLARNLGISSVAEGIEDQATTAKLVELGIDFLQGYHFSRPLPMERLLPWLKTQKCPPLARTG